MNAFNGNQGPSVNKSTRIKNDADRVTFVCDECGSCDIEMDSALLKDPIRGGYHIVQTFPMAQPDYCRECGGTDFQRLMCPPSIH
jgi:hypothetical protein